MLKTIVNTYCYLFLLPAVLLFHLQSLVADTDSVFAGWSQFLSLLPGKLGELLRREFFARTSRFCGQGVCISSGSVFSSANISLGTNAYIGHFCSIGDVTIGDDVLIASHVSVMNGVRQHGTERLDIPIREQPGQLTPISIGPDSWIGEHATVAANVGRQCIIGAGALVLQPVPDFCVAVGVPARIVANRQEQQNAAATEPAEPTSDTPGLSPDVSPTLMDVERRQ